MFIHSIYHDLVLGLFFSLSLASLLYYLLDSVRKTNSVAARKMFYCPSLKSTTNAIQLGGLPYTLTLSAVIFLLMCTHFFQFHLSVIETKLLSCLLFCLSLGLFFGYLDDKLEISPIVKLGTQFIVAFVFSFTIKHILGSSQMFFVILFLVNLMVINGVNLVDGLDALALKLGALSFLAFSLIGYLYNIPLVLALSLLSLVILIPFYFYNRFPARIYLGESGTIAIALMEIMLSCLVVVKFSTAPLHYQSKLTALIPLSFFIFEVAISFLRRLHLKRSPFKGDRFHLHHILYGKLNNNSSSAGTIIFLIQLSIMLPALYISSKGFYVTAIIFINSLYLIFSLRVCLFSWLNKTELQILENLFANKLLRIMHSDTVTELDIELIQNLNGEHSNLIEEAS